MCVYVCVCVCVCVYVCVCVCTNGHLPSYRYEPTTTVTAKSCLLNEINTIAVGVFCLLYYTSLLSLKLYLSIPHLNHPSLPPSLPLSSPSTNSQVHPLSCLRLMLCLLPSQLYLYLLLGGLGYLLSLFIPEHSHHPHQQTQPDQRPLIIADGPPQAEGYRRGNVVHHLTEDNILVCSVWLLLKEGPYNLSFGQLTVSVG